MLDQSKKDKIISDLLRSIRLNKSFVIWMAFLGISLVICLYAYTLQLKNGLSVTGLGDYVSWGMYISNFVFFVATSLIGMLISAVLGLLGIRWASPLARIAEIIALAFAAVAGLVIVSDMGRPERLLYVFTHGRIQSPIVWDVTVVTVYVLISALFLYIPLLSDLKICYDKLDKLPPFLRNIYKILSLNWANTDEQRKIVKQSTRILSIFIIPVALAIHTVTSWLFANTSLSGWDSTIFVPYFVTGAFVSGCSAVIIAMYVYQKNYKLQDYITEGVGEPTLRDIIGELEKPGRDPRQDTPLPILRSDVLKMEDLTPGMHLKGTVRNVVDFGAFVDIGVKVDGLLHKSQVPNGTLLSVGDILDVEILKIEPERNRISLGWLKP